MFDLPLAAEQQYRTMVDEFGWDGLPGPDDGYLAQSGDEQAEHDEDGQPQQDSDSDDGSGLGPDVDDSEEEVLDFGNRWEAVSQILAPAEDTSGAAAVAGLEASGLVNQVLDRSFRIAQQELQARSIAMPWEKGLAAAIFRPTDWQALNSRFQRPEFRFPVNTGVPVPDPSGLARLKAQAHSAFPLATRRLKDMTVADASDLLRSRALGRWKQIIQVCPEASDIGRTLLRELQHLKADASLIQLLSDTVAKKSASTLLKRSGEILKFVCFCVKRGVEPFPFDEFVCYQYLCHMAEAKTTKATNASSFRSAVAFCLHTFGFDGSLCVLESKRSQGIAHRLKASKAPLKQKRPFTVAEIVALEGFAADKHSVLVDAIFVAHILFCIYSRSRWGDHQGIESLDWDLDACGGGFVQGNTRRAKTSVTAEQKTRFLPLTAPLCNLSKFQWWLAWQRNRAEAGLEVSALVPFLPAPAGNGDWCKRPVSAGEASAWIREILRALGFDASDLGSHSCKATCLSWCARAGVSHPTRLLLGYHVYGTSKTMLHYSRDALSGPLRVLNRVLAAIVAHKFFPDLTRSGYFAGPNQSLTSKRVRLTEGGASSSTGPAKVVEPGTPGKVVLEMNESESASDSSDESSGESSLDESEVATVLLDKTGTAPAKAGGKALYVHVRLGTVHRVRIGQEQRLACGRLINSAFKAVAEDLLHYVKCVVCFGSRP